MDVAAMVGIAVVVMGLPYVCRWLGRRLQPPDVVIDTLIHPPVFRYVEHDDDLRVETQRRRERAEAIKRDARLLETNDDRVVRLRKVM